MWCPRETPMGYSPVAQSGQASSTSSEKVHKPHVGQTTCPSSMRRRWDWRAVMSSAPASEACTRCDKLDASSTLYWLMMVLWGQDNVKRTAAKDKGNRAGGGGVRHADEPEVAVLSGVVRPHVAIPREAGARAVGRRRILAPELAGTLDVQHTQREPGAKISTCVVHAHGHAGLCNSESIKDVTNASLELVVHAPHVRVGGERGVVGGEGVVCIGWLSLFSSLGSWDIGRVGQGRYPYLGACALQSSGRACNALAGGAPYPTFPALCCLRRRPLTP
jgi:hypothetical protein